MIKVVLGMHDFLNFQGDKTGLYSHTVTHFYIKCGDTLSEGIFQSAEKTAIYVGIYGAIVTNLCACPSVSSKAYVETCLLPFWGGSKIVLWF